MDNTIKIPLPQFLKLLSNNNIPVTKAIDIAGKIYKEYNTPDTLAQLSDLKLKALGISSNDDRKLVLSAFAKAGYTTKPRPARNKVVLSPEANTSPSPPRQNQTSVSHPTPIITPSKALKRKRKPNRDNEFLPSDPTEESQEENAWDFNELLDDNLLKLKTCVINRAPVMMAWSMFVAEKMHFSRSEALSLASVYTEMNAVSKGVSLGIYRPDEERGREAVQGGSQPYVELIGRKPLYQTKQGQWQALSNGKPSDPKSAFDYISRSFRQTSPFVMGALKLLADSYPPAELIEKAWSLYAEFRPEANEWGKRSEVRCSKILDLRKKHDIIGQQNMLAAATHRNPEVLYESIEKSTQDDGPQRKKIKSLRSEPLDPGPNL